MNLEAYIEEAIQIFSAWELEEPELSQAITDQARLMAGINPDHLIDPSTNIYPPLC